jgi:LPXTG-motif cell wall-anchored protein
MESSVGSRWFLGRSASSLCVVTALVVLVVPLLMVTPANADYPPAPGRGHRIVHPIVTPTPVQQTPPAPARAVTMPTAEPKKSALASTGAQVIGEATLGLSLILIGLIFLVLVRRRRRSG